MKGEYKYSALAAKIIVCAKIVHKQLGNVYQEEIYKRALEVEMRLAGIKFSAEFDTPIFFREEQVGKIRIDFLVEEAVSVDLKAITKIEDAHFIKATKYLEASNLEMWLLINFSETKLNFNCLTNKNLKYRKYRNKTNHISSI